MTDGNVINISDCRECDALVEACEAMILEFVGPHEEGYLSVQKARAAIAKARRLKPNAAHLSESDRRKMDRAHVEVGFMSTAEYVAKWGGEDHRPSHVYWLSWHSSSPVFVLSSPWWATGRRLEDNSTIFCGAVRASSVGEAKELIVSAYGAENEIEWRFVEQREPDWSPFSDRFPRADWMEW